MDIILRQVDAGEKEILANLLEKYECEFSPYTARDVNGLGLYGYGPLPYYWTEDRRWAYFILVDGKLAGFVMINSRPVLEGTEVDYSVAEFFVLHKYRRLGVGKYAMKQVFDQFKGRWQIGRHPNNRASVYFWDSVVREHTKGNYVLLQGVEQCKYGDGALGDVFCFEIGS